MRWCVGWVLGWWPRVVEAEAGTECGVYGAAWVPNCFWLGSLGEETPISLVVEFFEGVTVGVGVERGCIGISRCGTKGTEFRVFGRG